LMSLKVHMKSSFRQAGFLLAALLLVCTGCVLFGPPHSEYRPIHQYATDCNTSNVVADLATVSSDLNLEDDGGRTPLHIASGNCCTGVVMVLLQKHAKMDVKGKAGETPLHVAAQEGCSNAVLLLLDHGAKINARDKQSRTPLKRAIEYQQPAIADILRSRGGVE
jgi:ankyrin